MVVRKGMQFDELRFLDLERLACESLQDHTRSVLETDQERGWIQFVKFDHHVPTSRTMLQEGRQNKDWMPFPTAQFLLTTIKLYVTKVLIRRYPASLNLRRQSLLSHSLQRVMPLVTP